MRFLPTRKLQNAFSDVPWEHTVGDDLDSFTYVFVHALLFRGHQRDDKCTARIRGYYYSLGNEHPKTLMDIRDSFENSLWIIGEDVKKLRAEGQEPDGKTIAQFAEPLYRVTKVNVAHHSDERALALKKAGREGAKERAAKQYEEYMKAMVTLKESIDEGWARKAEEKRKKAEIKAQEKAQKAKEVEKAENIAGALDQARAAGGAEKKDCVSGETCATREDDAAQEDAHKLENFIPGTSAADTGEIPMEIDSEEVTEVTMVVSSHRVEASTGTEVSEPPSKRARVE